PNLRDATTEWTRILGVEPAEGGTHPALGTRNALFGLGSSYLEIIAPDAANTYGGPMATRLARLAEPALVGWVVRVDNIEGWSERRAVAGVRCTVAEQHRTRPDGSILRWRMGLMEQPELRMVMPHLIHWGDSPHPSLRAPQCGSLASIALASPDTSVLDK